jgi:mannosyltransferase
VTRKIQIKWEFFFLATIVIVGLALRLHESGYNFDTDEVFSVNLASKNIVDVLIESLQDRPHPPLYNILLYFWMTVFGPCEISARALSVLFSGVFLLTTYALFRRFMAQWLALGLLVVPALSPLFVYYGQQVRPYALIACLSSMNLLAYIRLLDDPQNRRRVVVWACSCTLLLYSQYLAVFPIAVQFFLVLFLPTRRKTILAYGTAGVVLILPWFITAMASSVLVGADPLPQISWIHAPSSLADLWWFYVSIFGSGPGMPTCWLLIAFLIPGFFYGYRILSLKNLPLNNTLFLIIGIGFPIIIYLESVWGPKPIFVGRQMLGAALAALTVLGLCLATLPRNFAAVLLLFIVAWTAISTPSAFPHYTKPPWRAMAAFIDERYGDISVILQENWPKDPLQYYRKKGVVRHWNEVPDSGKEDHFLFLCRNPIQPKCSNIENEVFQSRRLLLKTMRWGHEPTDYPELRLYEVQSVRP